MSRCKGRKGGKGAGVGPRVSERGRGGGLGGFAGVGLTDGRGRGILI